MRRPNTYDLIYLADNEWGNTLMQEVAQEYFQQHPDVDFVMVYEHAGWWLAYHRSELEIVGTANDMAVFRQDRPKSSGYSGVCIRREALRPDIREVTTLRQYVEPAPELLAVGKEIYA